MDDATLVVSGDQALDLWNATQKGACVAVVEFESGREMEAEIIEIVNEFDSDEPIVRVQLSPT